MSEENKSEDVNVEQTSSEPKKVTAKTKAKPNKPTKAKRQKDVKVKILCHNAAGKYGLPQSKGMTVILKEKQADELVNNNDGEIVK
jgi:hypothetical protein